MKIFSNRSFADTGTGFAIVRGIWGGVGIGIAVTCCLFLLALAVEGLNVSTGGYFQKLLASPVLEGRKNLLYAGGTGAVGVFPMWSWGVFFNVAAFFSALGGPIGAVYGFALQKQIAAGGGKWPERASGPDRQRAPDAESGQP